MEPFNLTLQQVNLEEKDITEDDTLHSFSNLVSFDSDFASDKPDVFPVLGKSVLLSQQENEDTQQAIFSKQYHGAEEVFPIKHHLVGSFTSPPTITRHRGDSVAIEPNEDSFIGFTDAADALALQKSVIGNVPQKAAAEDKVAILLADAQEKLLMFNDTLSNSSIPSGQEDANSSFSDSVSSEAVVAEYRRHKHSMYSVKQREHIISEQSTEHLDYHNDSGNDTEFNRTKTESFSSTSDAENITGFSESIAEAGLSSRSVGNTAMTEQSDGLVFVSESSDINNTQVRELIPIPGDQLVKHVKKRASGWFGKKESKKQQKKVKQFGDGQPPNAPIGDTAKLLDGSNQGEKAGSEQLDTSSLSLESGHYVGTDSETGSVADSSVTEFKGAMQSPVHNISAESRASTSETVTLREHEHVGISTVEHVLETQHITHEESVTVSKEVKVIRETPDLPPQQNTHQILLTRRDASGEESLRAEVDRLMRENAKLEGKIEVLQAESAAVIKERAQLQSLVATLQQQVKVAHSSVEEIKSERDAVVADIETLKLNRNNLEQVIMNAKKLLQDRDEDIRTLNEDLKLSHKANEKLQKKIKEDKMEMVSSQSVIQDLKAKIAELYVDFQMSNQDKILAESEIKSLQSEIKSLAMAKEWYQEQLQLCQEAKLSLQKEVSSIKSEVIAQTTMVERIKADNIHIKQLLTEAEQRALSEKEKLAHHLEAIESQMMEREATFAQLQQQKETIEATLQQRLDRGQQEIPREVAEELKKAQNELRRRQATISVLEHEQADLVKRLTLSQESILERDTTIESLGRRLVDSEVQVQQGQLHLREKDDEIFKLMDEKSGIEVEVDSLKKEKQAINSALQTLKADMGKVELSFKHLKQELKNKQQQIEQLTADNSKLDEELRDSQKAADMARVDGELRHESLQGSVVGKLDEDKISDVGELQERVAALQTRDVEMTHRLEAVRSESGLLIEELRSENHSLEERMSELRQQLEASRVSSSEELAVDVPRSEVKNLVNELQVVEEWLAGWNNKSSTERTPLMNELLNQQLSMESFVSNHRLNSQELILLVNAIIIQNKHLINMLCVSHVSSEPCGVENHETFKSEYQIEIEQLGLKLNSVQEENVELRKQLSDLTQKMETESSEFGVKLLEQQQLCEQESSAVSDLQNQIEDLKSEKEQLEQELANVERTSCERASLQQENSNLKSKLAELETETHKQIAKQQAKALKIGKDLEAALKVTHQQREEHDTLVKEYEEKVSAVVIENDKLKERVEQSEKRFSLDQDEKTTQLQHELHEVHLHYEEKTRLEVELREILSRHEVDMSKYVARIDELQRQLAAAEAMLEHYRNNEDDMRKLMLELEREKGRLAGAMESHSALKEHTSSLEAALAQHESSSVQVNSELATTLDRKQKEADYLMEQMEQLQEALNTEKQTSQTIQQQLVTERTDHVKIRRELESLFVEHDQLKVIAIGYEQAVKSLNDELEKVRESDGKHRAELEHLSQEVRLLREERDRFFAELEARRNKEPITQEQIMSLEWQVTEKNNEILALKEQLDVVNERQQLETNTLATSLQSAKNSLKELREELLSLKQEKTILLSRIAELKAALQACLQHVKLLQETVGESDNVGITFDLTSLENLLKEYKQSTVSSKPLSFLQATLSKLRGEISGLQNQVDEHAMAVQTTSKAWKEFEEQVRDLREVCKISAADRAASQKILLEGKKLSENPLLPETASPEQPASEAD
ncbi:hypothetical protein LSH36_1142g00048 [Paralvinella palmiformis]|uniref:Uncharacterized protein n=1 Tax=Paralvinella palmiformis TaxID=53620 RepID=A0AAD9IVN5_9ANNE|nr:hypothetical protein LSH36_1142g00048 [Paralvinella palmiformis]